jgi:cysteine desulfurase
LETALLAEIDGLRINARDADRLPNTSSLTFPGVDADALLLNMPKVMLGTGSACTSGAVEPSHVLTAIGLNRAESSSTIRLSLGRFTYQHELREIIALLFQTSATLSD